MSTLFYFGATLCLVAVVSAEPPVSNGGKSIVSQRLLNRVADIIANGGDGSTRGDDGTQENEGARIVDKELLDRIARIISQNDGQLSWSQKNQQQSPEFALASNNNEATYGIPPVESPAGANELAGTLFELSPPEAVPRIASFDFTDEDDTGYVAESSLHQDTYANNYQGRPGRIQFQEPSSAQRIASFSIEGEQPPPLYSSPNAGRTGSGYSTLRRH